MKMNFDQMMSICRGCLAADRKMVSATLYEAEFKDLTGITISPSDGLPQWLCYECIALLQKCVRFGNKVMKSHYTLCKCVLENVPFACDKDDKPHLSRSFVLHCDVPGTQTEQPEDPIENSAVSALDIPIITKIESVKVKDEIVSCISEDDIKVEECGEQSHHIIINVPRKSSSCSLPDLYTNNICLVMLNHEERTEQGELEEQISPGVADTDLKTAEVKDESSSPDRDDITIEEWCIDPLFGGYELESKTSICKPEQEEQAEQEQKAREIVRAGTCAARHSVRAQEHINEHTDISSTSRKQVHEENFKSNVNINDSVNGNSCSNVKLYVCDVCNKCFSNKSLLIAHIRGHSLKQKVNHTGEESHKCDLCTKTFYRKQNRDRHMRTHTGERPYKCDICTKAFYRKDNRDNHMFTHTGERPYKCDVCPQAFTQKHHYSSHMRIHTGEKPYKCDVCTKAYCRKHDYDRHMRTHTGEKPHKCDVCMKGFKHKKDYNRHALIHTGELYKCDVCTKVFYQKENYDYHMRTHTGERERPYKCDVCTKAFYRKDHRDNHMRTQCTNTGERQYKCDVCAKDFYRKHDYDRHMRTHTDQQPHKCEVLM